MSATKIVNVNATKRIEIPPATQPAASIAVFDIRGISPLLMNNPITMARPSTGIAVKKIPTPQEEADAKVYRLDDGQLYVPSDWFRASLLAATTGRRIGKFAAAAIVSGAVFTVEEKCPLVTSAGKPVTTWAIDTRRAVVQGMGVLRSRPKIDDWAVALALEIDPQLLPNPSLVEELLNIAGKIKGVGDNRPGKKGSNGRYVARMREAS